MAKSKKKKIVDESHKQKVSGNKMVKELVNPEEYKSKNPVWRFNRYDKEHPEWCLHNKEFYTDLMIKLVSFEGMTWHSIEAASGGKSRGTNSHFIPVSNLTKEAQKRLEELKIYYDELFSLRLTSKERLFGILENGIFHIIWYDADHKICPVTK